MAEFVLNRNKTIIGLSGHSVIFEKGIPTYVPEQLVQQVISIGAERVDAAQGESFTETPPKAEDPQGEERQSLIYLCFEELIRDNKREEFTASGAPHSKALKQHLGFTVDNKERDLLWAKYRAEKGAEE